MIDEDNDLDGINGDAENSIQQSQGDQVPPVGTDLWNFWRNVRLLDFI